MAQKGHKLLKEKGDSLVLEFFTILTDITKIRKMFAERLIISQKSMRRAQAVQGMPDIERLSLAVTGKVDLSFVFKNIVGVSIPKLQDYRIKKDWYGYFESSVELDNAIESFRSILPVLFELVEKQIALQKIAKDLKQTKRKVNSLENLIIPKLEDSKKVITFKLEELSRENFARLKKVKEHLEATV